MFHSALFKTQGKGERLMYSLLFVILFLVAILSTVAAMLGKYQYYWVAAISTYIFSFIAGFSIGQMTVGLTFVFLGLAFGTSFKWIKNTLHYIIFIGVGAWIGLLAILFVDDYWLFFPFTLFF